MITTISFLFIFFASYGDASYIVTHIDQDFKDDTYKSYEEIPKLDNTEVFGPNALRDFYVVLIFGLVTLQLNLFGSLYIIYRTYLQWKRGGRNNVPLSLRFPFYIAMTDSFLSLGYTVNLSYTLIYKLPWANPACQIIGSTVITLFTLNIFLVGIIAITTWCCVCKEYYIEFGPYDYKLWTLTLALSVLVIGLSIDKTGQQKYWCAGRHHSIFVPITMIIFICLVLITILFCYIKILLKVQNNDDNLLITRYQQRSHVEKRAVRKLISYIFTFILQFIPLLAYNFFSLAMVENLLLHVLAITAINFGGIGNFIQFVINEGLSDSKKSNSQSSSVIKEQTTLQTNSVASNENEDIVTPVHEIKVHIEVSQSNTTNNLSEVTEITPDLTSEELKDDISNNNISHLEEEKEEKEEKSNKNTTIEINIDTYDGDDVLFYDAVTTIDASANSSDTLLGHDDNF